MVASLAMAVVAQGAPTICAANCADCRTDSGVISCYSCFRSAYNAAKQDCSGVVIPNCLFMNIDGKCSQCELGYALDIINNNCAAKGTITDCILEQVDAPNKCIICNGSFPTDDLTACGNKAFPNDADCLWGTVLGKCSRCRYDNLMAAYSGECVGRYLYGCLQENGVNRCNYCDHERGYSMKFPTLCWKQN